MTFLEKDGFSRCECSWPLCSFFLSLLSVVLMTNATLYFPRLQVFKNSSLLLDILQSFCSTDQEATQAAREQASPLTNCSPCWRTIENFCRSTKSCSIFILVSQECEQHKFNINCMQCMSHWKEQHEWLCGLEYQGTEEKVHGYMVVVCFL